MRSLLYFAATIAGVLAIQEAPRNVLREQVGPLPDGGFLLNSGWTIRPAGQQVPVDTFPMSTAVSSNGKYLLVMNGGYDPPSISVIDIAKKREIGRTPMPDCWLGLTVAPKGDLVYVGGGSAAAIYELSLDPESGALKRVREFSAVADASNKGTAFIGDVALSPDQHLLYAADLYNDSIAVINLQSGRLIDRWKTGRRPYRILVPPGGRQLIVSSWADAAIYQHDANSGTELGKTRVGPHPTDMIWINKPAPVENGESSYPARLFVAAANTNSVYSMGVTQDGQLHSLESINVSMTPMHPLGMTPSALATDTAGTHLYVVCSDANAVAEADISGARTRVLGFIPSGWYPTAVRVLDDGELVILNGKGLGSHPNPNGPNPSKRPAPVNQGGQAPAVEYVGHIQTGTVAFIPAVTSDDLSSYTGHGSAQFTIPGRDVVWPDGRRPAGLLFADRRTRVADSACDLCDQRKPHVRSGARRH